jgi:hypothetical protein
MNKRVFFLMRSTLLVVLLLAACGPQTFTVKLQESDVNKLAQKVVVTRGPDDLLVEVTGVDMQDGLIRVNGQYEREDGSIIPGNLDVTFAAKDGVLIAEIVAVHIAGVELTDERIPRINEEMARLFARAASEVEQVKFNSVTITGDEMAFVVAVALSSK